MPTLLETERLLIRSFIPEDLPQIHRILDQAFGDGHFGNDPVALAERRSWLEWSRLNQEWFTKMHQPPYGDRAVVLKSSGACIGAAGLVPCLDVFDQIPELCAGGQPSGYCTPEVGLFWAIDPTYQRRGYATEAARALIEHAFAELNLGRIIATTEEKNLASQGVMRRLGMTITRNPLPTPSWLQVVGILFRT